jgi:hypothetical protein
MKKSVIILLFIGLVSCIKPKTAQVEHTYANGNIKIRIEGLKDELVGPWKVTMRFKVYGFEESKMEVKIYADEISDKTVSFNWQTPTECIISFKQSDDKTREFKLTASPNTLEIVSIN